MDPNDEDSWFRQWEQQYDALVPDFDQEYANEQESCRTFLFGHFQESAGAIGHLYAAKRLPHGDEAGTLWTAFRVAAETVTGLYRASMEGLKRSGEAGNAMGHARRSRELIGWVRKYRRPHIRRDDLLAYLTGKPPPPALARPFHRTSPRTRNISPPPVGVDAEANLDMFSEALATTQLTSAAHRPTGRSPQRGGVPAQGELCAFIASEIARHRKRPAPSSSPADVTMDSPTHHHYSKRQRHM